MKRRQFLKSSAYGLSGLAIGNGAHLLSSDATVLAQVPSGSSEQAFRVPPMDTGKREGHRVHFDLNIRNGSSQFFQGISTQTMGINGDYLGPVLRAQRGDRVSFAVKNSLKEASTMHWHGFILPAKMDGGPHQEIHPGGTWRPEFDVIQPASTYWYHSHQHKRTGEQVYHGLAGMFIIDDETSLKSGLPSDYGVDDLPVVIQDRAFNRDGSFRYLGSMPDRMHGMHGDVMLVNGVITPTLKAERQVLRLRLLNGSNARIYQLAFKDARPFIVIAGDGGFLPVPAKVQHIRLSPGERAEILVDMGDGRDAVLINRAQKAEPERGMMGRMMGMEEDGVGEFNIMRIQAPSLGEIAKVRVPKQMLPLPDWVNAEAVTTRRFALEMTMGPRMMMSMMGGGSPFSISGASMDMKVINHRVKSNTVELWEVSNPSMRAHPFHIHNTQFKVLARSSEAITATEQGLKDTVLVSPNETVRLLVPFPEYSDPDIPYMYHCHILEHEDAGMMGQFTVSA